MFHHFILENEMRLFFRLGNFFGCSLLWILLHFWCELSITFSLYLVFCVCSYRINYKSLQFFGWCEPSSLCLSLVFERPFKEKKLRWYWTNFYIVALLRSPTKSTPTNSRANIWSCIIVTTSTIVIVSVYVKSYRNTI